MASIGIAKAQGELTPPTGASLIINGPNSSNAGTFNGTINGENVAITSITFVEDADGVFIFKNVNTTELIIQEGADVRIQLTGGNNTNTISKITNNGSLFFEGNTFLPETEDQDVTNNAFLTDSTTSIRIVQGPANLIIGVTEGSEVHNSQVAEVNSIIVSEASPESITMITQRKNQNWWNNLDTIDVPYLGHRIIHFGYAVERAGQYRFQVIIEKEGVSTSLLSRTAEVKMSYDVILPEVEGVTTDPAAGTYIVPDDKEFKFYLSLDKGYSQSEPFVTTSKKDTLELDWDRYYTIPSITDSVTIFIDGIALDNPSSNQGITTEDIIINSGQGQIEIYTPEATRLQILTFDGITRKNLRLTAGNHLITMPAGIYLLQMDRKTVKVRVR